MLGEPGVLRPTPPSMSALLKDWWMAPLGFAEEALAY